MAVHKALTIAGSDSGGGAGIQADIKTFQELGVYGMSAITAVTAQNSVGVQGVYPLDVCAVTRQIDSVGADFGADAVKTGMLFGRDIIHAVADKLKQYGWVNVVVDPVMVAKGGTTLLQAEAVDAVRNCLLPLSAVVTPNIPEAEALAGMEIATWEQRKEAASRICAMGARYAVIKGGHDASGKQAVDLLFDGRHFTELAGARVATKHTHGTGCTFSAAIAAELAKGKGVPDAVCTAKRFIQCAIEDAPGIGCGYGPTNHWAYRARGN